MNDIEFKIQRYEIYPPTNSDSYVVGFKIIDKLNNDASVYVEVLVPLSDCVGKTINEICQIGFLKIKSQVDSLVSDLKTKRNNIIGYTFIPNA